MADETFVETPRSRNPALAPERMTWTDALVPRALIRFPFASLPDPYPPVLAIWQLGYALAAVEPDAIKLVAPAPPR